MSNYIVTATILNMRSSPSGISTDNIISRLKNQEEVEVIDATIADWYKVKTIQRNPAIEGFVASQYLKEITSANPVEIQFLQPVNLPPNSNSRRNNHGGYPYPLGEPDLPKLDAQADVQSKITSMHQIVSYLSVDTSARYKRDAHTYCNIYAFDYTYLCGVFLPRMWWTDKAIIDLKAGVALTPKYEITVDEVNANSLFSWLERWGEDFGWTRTYDIDDLQAQVNLGKVGVISGPNINPRNSGHICCVLPEKGDHIATRVGGKVTCPLLSQAGARNFTYYNNNRWWFLKQIKTFGFWYI